MRQYVPQENPPNIEVEKPNKSLSITNKLAKNGLQHISIFPNKREHKAMEKRDNLKQL